MARVFNYISNLVNIKGGRVYSGKYHPHALEELKFHTFLISYQKRQLPTAVIKLIKIKSRYLTDWRRIKTWYNDEKFNLSGHFTILKTHIVRTYPHIYTFFIGSQHFSIPSIYIYECMHIVTTRIHAWPQGHRDEKFIRTPAINDSHLSGGKRRTPRGQYGKAFLLYNWWRPLLRRT